MGFNRLVEIDAGSGELISSPSIYILNKVVGAGFIVVNHMGIIDNVTTEKLIEMSKI